MRILLNHVDPAWTTALVQGPHTYLVPTAPCRSLPPPPAGWPPAVEEVPIDRLRAIDVDVAVLQQPHEIGVVEQWTGRRPGRDLPAVYVEHRPPDGGPGTPCAEHPVAARNDLLLVHTSAFNELFWNSGRAPTTVVAPGVPDPGERSTGRLARAATVIDAPLRQGRAAGTDLLAPLAATRPIDVFGVDVDRLTAAPGLRVHDGLGHPQRLDALAQRRVYVHTARWTGITPALVEAMLLGLPVVAIAATEVAVAVPPEAGVLTTSRRGLLEGVARFVDDAGAAAAAGREARRHALRTWGLQRFLDDWDAVLERVSR